MCPLNVCIVAGGLFESIPAAGIYHANKRASKDKL